MSRGVLDDRVIEPYLRRLGIWDVLNGTGVGRLSGREENMSLGRRNLEDSG
jgi:hypothetical protein